MQELPGSEFTLPADLVLIDLATPEREAMETILRIRAGFPATRIVAMSGERLGTYLRAVQAMGASEVLVKPVSAETLLNKVRQLLDG